MTLLCTKSLHGQNKAAYRLSRATVVKKQKGVISLVCINVILKQHINFVVFAIFVLISLINNKRHLLLKQLAYMLVEI